MMQSIGRPRRHSLPVNAEINITNLVDIAFVLLIIFIITAPIMQAGLEIELPKADAQPLTTSDAVVVSINQEGRIFLDESEVSLEEFPKVFSSYMTAHEGQPISVQGDTHAQWGRMIDVFSQLRNLGHNDVNLLLEPLPGRRRR